MSKVKVKSLKDQYIERVRSAMSLETMMLKRDEYIEALEELQADIEAHLEAAIEEQERD